jgi:CheY-like chemotaxis protein/anti-sigma regulatory factor (Ser/Thr protein kinase)
MALRVLIVEDDADTALVLSETLRGERHRFEPTVLNEGKDVFAWARHHKPDLIVLDLMLPDVDGFDLCQQLKLDRETNLIPIMMLTARSQQADRDRGLAVGANYYLTKPFTDEQLRHAIAHVLNWRDEIQRRGTEGEIHFRLLSDTRYLEELNQLLSSLFLFTPLSESQIKQLCIAVREMGTNAIEWGHRKQIDRVVTVTFHIDNEKVTIHIRDEGPGFNPKELPHAARGDDPLAHLQVREALGLREGGFGILMTSGLVDRLQYNALGNEVSLVKYFTPRQAARATPAPR